MNERPIPRTVRFVGGLPIMSKQAPLPPWAHELRYPLSRKRES